ncbi:SH3 domain-containing protein [Roseibaca sp. Y0-43]|uniref:SH3 domain-containing protein n=1 Tax=Roseibaca sp. Y0-43 TaxID=2816854 RepID=UPI001D0C8672|nr:SH3 domain-containing protein [Roseibaca sp. Y0-43]MCC1480780.1 SH3 domain-containing protein [Roseibaca sp. Y0-43]
MLDIRIDGAAGAAQDFADGLTGGPDYWEVTGVSGSLNIRTAPSTSAPGRMGLLRGTVVQNLGCRMNEGRRWCEVAQMGGGVTGWAAGEYLREAAAPQQPAIPPAGSGTAGSGGDPLVAAAERACLRDVTQVTNNSDASVLRSMFSEAGTEVIVGVGPQRAPWRCIAYRDGTTAGIMSLTNEGAAVSPPPSNAGSVMRVTGVAANDLLNVRSGPGTANRVIGALGNGDSVRVLTCQNVSGAQCCEIEMMTDMRERGWVNARYLQ